jgi:ABC-2 type transport system permease protein
MAAHFFGDTAVLTGRTMRHVTRSPDTIITTAIMPVALLLLFVYVLGGAIKHGPGSYVSYLLPGILLITIASGISYTAFRLFADAHGGIFERFQSMPIARSGVLWAHVLTSLAANVISLVAVVGVALLMGFRSGAGVLAWLAVAAILILFTVALTWLAVIAGLTAKSVDGASAFSYPLIFLPFIDGHRSSRPPLCRIYHRVRGGAGGATGACARGVRGPVRWPGYAVAADLRNTRVAQGHLETRRLTGARVAPAARHAQLRDASYGEVDFDGVAQRNLDRVANLLAGFIAERDSADITRGIFGVVGNSCGSRKRRAACDIVGLGRTVNGAAVAGKLNGLGIRLRRNDLLTWKDNTIVHSRVQVTQVADGAGNGRRRGGDRAVRRCRRGRRPLGGDLQGPNLLCLLADGCVGLLQLRGLMMDQESQNRGGRRHDGGNRGGDSGEGSHPRGNLAHRSARPAVPVCAHEHLPLWIVYS